MTAYDPQIITKRLALLEDTILKLEKERPLTTEEISSRDVLSDATFYRIQSGIEAIIDIGNHILTEKYSEHPDTYKDTLLALGKHDILPVQLVEKNAAMVDFRNILVHHYVDIDPEKALENIEKAADTFRQFAEKIVTFTKRTDTDTY